MMLKNNGLIFLSAYLAAALSFADEYSVEFLAHQIAEAQTQIEIDISEIKPGEKLEVEYNGGPVWIYKRTREDLEYLQKYQGVGLSDKKIEAIVKHIKKNARSTSSLLAARIQLVDQPKLEKSPYRSKNNNYFVFKPAGRHGCALQLEIPSYAKRVEGALLFDPCFGDQYDSAGRFIDQGAKTYSLHTGKRLRSDSSIFPRQKIPPHRYKSEDILIIGVSDINMLPEIALSKEEIYSGLTPTETLFTATAYNDFETAEVAIKGGADVNSPGDFPEIGSLPLLRAVIFSSVDVVELLISHGATPNTDELEWAKRVGRTDVIELLTTAKQNK